MSSWEQRMSQRAESRRAQEAAREAAEHPLVKGHEGHHFHLAGTAVYCSCGEYRGVTSVAFEEGYDESKLSCEVCGAPGVALIGSRRHR